MTRHWTAVFLFGGLVSGVSAPARATSPTLGSCDPQPGNTRLWGIADTHSHQFANLAFGGKLFWGRPFDPSGNAARALPNCSPAHGDRGLADPIGGLLSGRLTGHSNFGYPRLTEWPSWNTIDHQMMYVDWLYRAYQAGLRLMVMHAVNAEAICDLKPIIPRAKGRTCDDMEAVDLQLDGAKELERYVDRTAGGPGLGWYRIAYSPEQARQIIREGKLAIVLGIEVDNLFGCKIRGPCTEESVRRSVQKYYEKGVRHLFPIHLANNAFGGSALFGTFFDYNNNKLTGAFPETYNCSSLGFEYHLERPPGMLPRVLQLLGAGRQPNYPPGPTCNNSGLTPLGEVLIREMMRRGMLFEVDHMSYRAEQRAIEIAAEHQYPLVAGHTEFLDMGVGQNRSEYGKTEEQLKAIRQSGGMVGVLFNQGLHKGMIRKWVDHAGGKGVDNECPASSEMWAQAYLYAVETMGGPTQAGVAYASDQSLYAWLGPRFGDQKCGGEGSSQKPRVTYPIKVGGTTFDTMRFGSRRFDYNREGLANIGLLPEFIQDLLNVGVSEEQLLPLYHSADAYVGMWQRAAAIGRRQSQPR